MPMANMRNSAQSAWLWIVFGVIIIVFIFSFGPASNGCRKGALKPGDDSAAIVNGEKISKKKFEQTYARHLDNLRRQGGDITREQADQFGVGGQILSQLIDQELLRQAAKNEGIRVSDDEVAEELIKVEAFKVNGVFNQEAYKSIVERQLGLMVWQFEDQLRDDLLLQKKITGIQDSVRISDDEIAAEYIREKELYSVSAIRFSVSAELAALSAPSADEIAAYAKDHADDVAKKYDADKDVYNKPKQIHARHILIKTGSGVTVEAATAKINAIKARIQGGEDFATVAGAESEDPGSKVKGGDLGTFGEGVMVPEFQTAAFAMKAGELSEPVVTKFGVHLIKVEEVIDAKTISLQDATQGIARELMLNAQAKAKAQAKAQAALDALKNGTSFADQVAPKAAAPAPAAEAEAAEEGTPAEGEAAVAEGEAAPAADSEAAPAEKAVEAAIQAIADAQGKLQVESSGDFRLFGAYIPTIGSVPELASDLPKMELGAAAKVYDSGDSVLAISLDKHFRPDVKDMTAEEKDGYRASLKNQRSSEALKTYVDGLRNSAKITRDPSIGAGLTLPLSAN